MFLLLLQDIGIVMIPDPPRSIFPFLGIPLLLLKDLFVASPAIILPFLWSQAVDFERPSRLALSLVLVPLWLLIFAIIWMVFGGF